MMSYIPDDLIWAIYSFLPFQTRVSCLLHLNKAWHARCFPLQFDLSLAPLDSRNSFTLQEVDFFACRDVYNVHKCGQEILLELTSHKSPWISVTPKENKFIRRNYPATNFFATAMTPKYLYGAESLSTTATIAHRDTLEKIHYIQGYEKAVGTPEGDFYLRKKEDLILDCWKYQKRENQFVYKDSIYLEPHSLFKYSGTTKMNKTYVAIQSFGLIGLWSRKTGQLVRIIKTSRHVTGRSWDLSETALIILDANSQYINRIGLKEKIAGVPLPLCVERCFFPAGEVNYLLGCTWIFEDLLGNTIVVAAGTKKMMASGVTYYSKKRKEIEKEQEQTL